MRHMGTPLRVLFVEDSEDDAFLLRRELHRAGYDLTDLRVETGPAMRAALTEQTWDVVLSDFSLPHFDMPRALQVVQQLGLDLPFIIVSGTIGEEAAVEALKAGAHDFMAKGKLSRLVPAIERTMGEAAGRRARRQRERELEVIAALTGALRQAEARAALLAVIVDQAVELFQAAGAALAIHDPQTDEVVFEVARGTGERLAGQRRPAADPLLGGALTSGRPHQPPPMPYQPSSAVVPLQVHGGVLGLLWIERAAPLSPEDVRLLGTMADIAANALHRATLYEQTQRRLDRLTALRTIDLAINASQDMRIILDVLLGQVLAQLQVDAAALLLVNPIAQTLEPVAARGFRARPPGRTDLRLGQGLAGRAALEGRRLSFTDPHGPQALSNARTGRTDSAAPYLAAEFDPADISAEGFVSYHAVPLLAKGAVNGVLEVFHRQPLRSDAEWEEYLETLAGQAAIAINNTALVEGLQRSHAELGHAYDATIEGWSRALDLRDHETEGHTQRVTNVTLRLAQALGLGGAELTHVRRGALLHDIGKMGIPDHILLKPGPLTDDEWGVMRRHPLYAYELLSPVSYLRLALDIPHYHHERWDGTGYPYGLRGEQIPLQARLFTVVDVWDALRSDRPYRAGWPEDKVRAYLHSQAGTHFDPQIVEAFWALDL